LVCKKKRKEKIGGNNSYLSLLTKMSKKIEKSELSEMARTLIEKYDFFLFLFLDNDVDDDIDDDDIEIDDGIDNVVGGIRGGNLGFLHAQTPEARTPLGVCQYSFPAI
jgi:hypothetical protein